MDLGKHMPLTEEDRALLQLFNTGYSYKKLEYIETGSITLVPLEPLRDLTRRIKQLSASTLKKIDLKADQSLTATTLYEDYCSWCDHCSGSRDRSENANGPPGFPRRPSILVTREQGSRQRSCRIQCVHQRSSRSLGRLATYCSRASGVGKTMRSHDKLMATNRPARKDPGGPLVRVRARSGHRRADRRHEPPDAAHEAGRQHPREAIRLQALG